MFNRWAPSKSDFLYLQQHASVPSFDFPIKPFHHSCFNGKQLYLLICLIVACAGRLRYGPSNGKCKAEVIFAIKSSDIVRFQTASTSTRAETLPSGASYTCEYKLLSSCIDVFSWEDFQCICKFKWLPCYSLWCHTDKEKRQCKQRRLRLHKMRIRPDFFWIGSLEWRFCSWIRGLENFLYILKRQYM